jgi:hypothetical protein
MCFESTLKTSRLRIAAVVRSKTFWTAIVSTYPFGLSIASLQRFASLLPQRSVKPRLFRAASLKFFPMSFGSMLRPLQWLSQHAQLFVASAISLVGTTSTVSVAAW